MCWHAMPLGAGILRWVLACRTIEKKSESLVIPLLCLEKLVILLVECTSVCHICQLVIPLWAYGIWLNPSTGSRKRGAQNTEIFVSYVYFGYDLCTEPICVNSIISNLHKCTCLSLSNQQITFLNPPLKNCKIYNFFGPFK